MFKLLSGCGKTTFSLSSLSRPPHDMFGCIYYSCQDYNYEEREKIELTTPQSIIEILQVQEQIKSQIIWLSFALTWPHEVQNKDLSQVQMLPEMLRRVPKFDLQGCRLATLNRSASTLDSFQILSHFPSKKGCLHLLLSINLLPTPRRCRKPTVPGLSTSPCGKFSLFLGDICLPYFLEVFCFPLLTQ